MGCKGCGKDRMNDPVGRFRFKFIGKPNGILIKGAPSNYVQNSVYSLPYAYTRRPGFELLDPPPVLKVPAATPEDSAFEQVFVPPNLGDEEIGMTTKSGSTEDLSSPIPSGPPSSEPSAKSTEPPAASAGSVGVRPVDVGGGFPLLPAKKKVEHPFEDRAMEAGDDMPPEFAYELRTMGDGIIGVNGEEKIEPKKAKKQPEGHPNNS